METLSLMDKKNQMYSNLYFFTFYGVLQVNFPNALLVVKDYDHRLKEFASAIDSLNIVI